MGTCRVFHLKGNANNLSETRSEASDNVSAESLDERLRLFGHGAALYVYRTVLEYGHCRDKKQ